MPLELSSGSRIGDHPTSSPLRLSDPRAIGLLQGSVQEHSAESIQTTRLRRQSVRSYRAIEAANLCAARWAGSSRWPAFDSCASTRLRIRMGPGVCTHTDCPIREKLVWPRSPAGSGPDDAHHPLQGGHTHYERSSWAGRHRGPPIARRQSSCDQLIGSQALTRLREYI
jgi:hypothetical protein